MPSIRLIGIDEDLHQILEQSPDEFERAYRASLGDGETMVREVVSQTLALLARVPRGPEWGGYLVVNQDHAAVVGTCGFKNGPEVNGRVEIAYFTFPQFEGRGYGTAMAKELVNLAVASRAVREVVAHTLPERSASTRILEKAGLRCVGEAHDPEDGRVWRWAYRPGG